MLALETPIIYPLRNIARVEVIKKIMTGWWGCGLPMQSMHCMLMISCSVPGPGTSRSQMLSKPSLCMDCQCRQYWILMVCSFIPFPTSWASRGVLKAFSGSSSSFLCYVLQALKPRQDSPKDNEWSTSRTPSGCFNTTTSHSRIFSS